jgi:predicted lipoprotein with Yx(FWY)xxD motif
MEPTTCPARTARSGSPARARKLSLLAVAAALGTAGFLAVGSIASGAGASVSLRTTKLGPVLVTPSGHTLYLFEKDRNGKSACSGACASFWPPLLAHGKPTAGPGVNASLLGTTRRSDGGMQVTYARHPLYTFALDKAAGQTKGEGSSAFGAKWYAVSKAGAAVIKPAATTTTTTTPTYTQPTYP